MAKLATSRASVILILLTSVIVFTACLHLASSKAGTGGPFDISRISEPRLSDVHFGEVVYASSATHTVEEREEILYDGVRRFVRNYHNTHPDMIFMVLTKDKSSWGQETFKPSRTFYDYLGLINSTGLDMRQLSLGIMTSSEEEYALYKNATSYTPIPRVTVLFRQSEDDHDPNWWSSTPRGGRHNHAIQTQRRMHVATLRNELMSRTLHDEEHIMWIDSDISYLSPGIVQMMKNHSQHVEDASVITARCQMGWNPDYDANSWQGARTKSPSSGRKAEEDETSHVPAQTTQKHIGELIKGTSDEDIVPLDSVGGTILYVRASLVHQGLTFPPYYTIGTGWGRDGWDGLETEGMCYVARYLRGGGCYTLGGNNSVTHTNN
jgi:hypothetical protein